MESDRIELRRVRDFGATINVIFEFVRGNFKPLGKSLVYIVGPVLLLASVASGVYLRTLIGVTSDFESMRSTNPSAVFSELGPVILLTVIAGVLSTVFLFCVVAGYVRLYVEGSTDPITVEDIWFEVKGSFWRVVGTIIVAILIAALPMFVVMLLAILMRELGLAVTALMFLAVFPMIYLYNCFSILIPMRLEEEIGVFAAARRCMHLMKGRWWFSFWVSVLILFVVAIVSIVFQIPLQLAVSVATLTGNEASGWIMYVGIVLSSIGSYMMYALLIVCCSVLYYNLVEQKEGVGMADRINEIGADPSRDSGVAGATSL